MFKICKTSLFVSFLGSVHGYKDGSKWDRVQYKQGQMVDWDGHRGIIIDVNPKIFGRHEYTVMRINDFVLMPKLYACSGPIKGWRYEKYEILVWKKHGHREFVQIMENVSQENSASKMVTVRYLGGPIPRQWEANLQDLYLPEDFPEIMGAISEGAVFGHFRGGNQSVRDIRDWIKGLHVGSTRSYDLVGYDRDIMMKIWEGIIQQYSNCCSKSSRDAVLKKYKWESPPKKNPSTGKSVTRHAIAPPTDHEGLWIIMIVLLVLCSCGAIFFVMCKSKAKTKADPDVEEDKAEQDNVEQDNVEQDKVEQDNDIEEGCADEL